MKKQMKIALGADHGGLELKDQLSAHLKSSGHSVQDVGTHSKDAVDYPRLAYAVAKLVASGECDLGIMVDGAGIGSAMAANKVRGVRAAACYSEALARNSREHNDANVLTLGAGQSTIDQAKLIVDVFLATECTAERHRKRVELITEIESGRMGDRGSSAPAAGREVALDFSPEDVERITKRVKELLAKGPAASGPGAAVPRKLGPAEIAQMIDHTILKPEASKTDVQKLCDEAVKHNFYSVCVNPAYVQQAYSLVRNSPVKVCCVVGFPLGAQSTQIKVLEARKALREGAREIDMVINIGALKSKEYDLVFKDIRGVVEACREGRGLSKVILETSLLTNEEKVLACELSMKANANFVKTSTGFSTGGATPEDIALMARTVAPKKLGVKASGGVRTYADAMKMIQAGATRIGSSNSVKILEEARAAS
jgi:deoxyribose-phosphate aldolase